MDWAILIASGVIESVWAISLEKTNGFTNPLPTVLFLVCYIGSVLGLQRAMNTIPVGTAYVVWTGIGASITVIYSMVTGAEAPTPARILLICGLLACVMGLHLIGK